MIQYCDRLWQLLTRSYQHLWTPNVRYRIHKSPQLHNTLSQMNSPQVGTLSSILILFLHLFLVSQVDCDCVVTSNTFNKSKAVHNAHTLRLPVTAPHTLPVPTAFLWQLTAGNWQLWSLFLLRNTSQSHKLLATPFQCLNLR